MINAMHTSRITFGKAALLAMGMLLVSALQAQPRPMVDGEHYFSITPAVATQANADTIEILDVFWYGCAVCMEFEPMMTYYGGEIRGDLTMRRMPAIWNPLMRTHAQLYYTAVQLELAERIHPAAFRYIQVEKQPLNNVDQIREFFASAGTSAEDFDTAWNSEEVRTAVAKAEQDTGAAGIDRLPSLVVNGRYRVVRNEGVPELTEVIITTNQLIRLLRDERRLD